MIDVHEMATAMTVAHLRHTPVLTVEKGDSLWDAWQLMSLSGLRCLAVVDATGACLGTISDRTILFEWPLTEEHLARRQVGSVMTTPGTLTDEETLASAAGKLTRAGVEAIPIVDDGGRLSGVLTVSDVAAWLARG